MPKSNSKSKAKKKESLLVKIVSPRAEKPLLAICIAVSLVLGTVYVAQSLAASDQNYYKSACGATTMLGVGSAGNCVKKLQWYLLQSDSKPLGKYKKVSQSCMNIDLDGKYGPKTRDAVKAFQRAHYNDKGKKLIVDGVVGKETWGALAAYRYKLYKPCGNKSIPIRVR